MGSCWLCEVTKELGSQASRWAAGEADAVHQVLCLMVQTLGRGDLFDSSECCARESVLLVPTLQMRKWRLREVHENHQGHTAESD